MSFFQPMFSNTADHTTLRNSSIDLKGRWADMNFVPAITGIVLALGVFRIGGDAIVQDLHAGAAGVLLLLASLAAYWILRALLRRDVNAPYATNGVFRFSRNPAYLAFLLPLMSLAYFDAMTALACTVLYVLAMNLLVIHQEERDLQKTYGEGFTSYRAATPRWFA
jgi:protein-S-isoprenylcysteine O-methyltransferase Ste14